MQITLLTQPNAGPNAQECDATTAQTGTAAGSTKIPPRIITWETNYNQKLACRAFTHIDLPPMRTPTRDQLQGTLIEICTADQSHPPVYAHIHDLMLLPMHRVNCWLAWHSHGMNEKDFADYMFTQHHHRGFNWNTLLAVYFYLRA